MIPNAGLPDEDGNYHETPENVATTLGSFMDAGWVNIIGGCCGTVNEHTERMRAVALNHPARTLVDPTMTVVSGLETLTIDEDTKPVLIGERTNVLGSRRFKRLIGEGNIEEASEIGRDQIRNGAHALDVCLQDPDRDEVGDITTFLERLVRKTRAPLVIDSTDVNVIEEALKRTQANRSLTPSTWRMARSALPLSLRLPDAMARPSSLAASTMTGSRRRPSHGNASWRLPGGRMPS